MHPAGDALASIGKRHSETISQRQIGFPPSKSKEYVRISFDGPETLS